jgi:hypothetical protein
VESDFVDFKQVPATATIMCMGTVLSRPILTSIVGTLIHSGACLADAGRPGDSGDGVAGPAQGSHVRMDTPPPPCNIRHICRVMYITGRGWCVPSRLSMRFRRNPLFDLPADVHIPQHAHARSERAIAHGEHREETIQGAAVACPAGEPISFEIDLRHIRIYSSPRCTLYPSAVIILLQFCIVYTTCIYHWNPHLSYVEYHSAIHLASARIQIEDSALGKALMTCLVLPAGDRADEARNGD